MKKQNLIYFAITAGCIIIILIMIKNCGVRNFLKPTIKFDETGVRNITKIDTVYISKPIEPLIINKIRTKIVYRTDTVLCNSPFISTVDTIIGKDTVKTEFYYPENVFTVDIRRKPDSLMFQKIFITETKEKERPWWEIPVYVTGGIIVGFLLGSSR